MAKITPKQANIIKAKFNTITGTHNQFFNEMADELGVHPTTIRRLCIKRKGKQQQYRVKKSKVELPGRWYTTVLVGTCVLGWQFLQHDPHTKTPPCFWWDSKRGEYRCSPNEYGEQRFEPYTRSDDIIHIWRKMMRPTTSMSFTRWLTKLSQSEKLDLSLLTPKIVCEAALLTKGLPTYEQDQRGDYELV